MHSAFSADTLRDRVAIVTGASQGIGRAIALELAKVGADVVACSRNLGALDAVAEGVRGHGRRALAVTCDVGDARQVDAAVARTLDAANFMTGETIYVSGGPRVANRED